MRYSGNKPAYKIKIIKKNNYQQASQPAQWKTIKSEKFHINLLYNYVLHRNIKYIYVN